MKVRLVGVMLVGVLAGVGCGGASGDLDGGVADAGAMDVGAMDAGATDAGATDAGATDAGATDAGATDAGATDAGATDAGATDAGATDAGATDAGATDAGVVTLECDGGTVLCDGQCAPFTPDNGCGSPSCAPCVPPDGGVSGCGGADGRTCSPICPSTTTLCSGACVSASPETGCGAPGCAPCALAHVVTASCTAGSCDYDACASGFEDVDGNRTNGCEAPSCAATEKRCPDGACRSMTVANGCGTAGTCGACPVVAPTGLAACVPDELGGTRCGVGACVEGFVLCNGECVGTTRTEFGCGSCVPCEQTMQHALIQFCSDQGTCDYLYCSDGYTDEDGDRSNGCEKPPLSCAAGQKSCPSGPTCLDNPFTGCAKASCEPCPGPTSGFGAAVCSSVGGVSWCGIQCNAGYKKCGTRCTRGDPALGCDGASCTHCATRVPHAASVGCYGTPGQTQCGYESCSQGWWDADGDRTNGCEAPGPGAIRPDALQLWLHADHGFVPGIAGTAAWSDLSPRNRTVAMGLHAFDGPPWAPAPAHRYVRHLADVHLPDNLILPSGTAGGAAMLSGEFTLFGTVARERNEESFLVGVTTSEREVRSTDGKVVWWECEPHGCMSIGFLSGTAFGARREMDVPGSSRALDLVAPVTPVAPGETQYLRFAVRFSASDGLSVTVVDQAGVRTSRQYGAVPLMPLGTAWWNSLTLFYGAVIGPHWGAKPLRLTDGIGELVLYNVALGAADVAAVEAWQRAQWGF